MNNLRYEEWCEQERDKLRETYLFMLNQLSIYYFENQLFDQCVQISQTMLETDNLLEEVHRKLMICYHHMGLPDLSIKQYFKCKMVWEKELGMPPSSATSQLFQDLKNGKVSF